MSIVMQLIILFLYLLNDRLLIMKIGVLGGGQLGKMLYQAGSRLNMDISFLENSHSCPVSKVSNQLTLGSFQNQNDVIAFGRNKDVITIEIENVNVEALKKLEALGKKVYPQPSVLEIIKDKGKQKDFYKANDIPTATYEHFSNKSQILKSVEEEKWEYPFVQKLCTGGYDGRGVQIIKNAEDLDNLFDEPSILETAVDIHKEISVIVARNPAGDLAIYPFVEMEFNPDANLVEFLISPARITKKQQADAILLAEKVVNNLGIVGIIAIEMFLNKNKEILVNESAPRAHNSGHQTIEANTTSQYEQHLRAISDLPLGSTSERSKSVMINLLGEPDHTGKAVYEGLDKVMAIEGVYPHIYGKEITKPYRKMGHITIIDKSLAQAIEKATFVKENIKVKT
jgi:5-(carboxyamino)imidazole ribonucleotide synthase